MSDPAKDLADLRAATREAHETIQSLRSVIKEGREVVALIEDAGRQTVEDRIDHQVAAGLARYGDSITTAIDNAQAAVDKRFDTLADILLGETKAERRKGETLTDLAQRAVDRREHP